MDKLQEIRVEVVKRLKDDISKKKIILGSDTEENRRLVEYHSSGIAERVIKAKHAQVTKEEFIALYREVAEEYFGYGPIQPLINDPQVTDIMVNGPNQIFVEKNGKLEKTGFEFSDEEEVSALITRMLNESGKRLDRSSPYVDFQIKDSSRVTAVIPPIAAAATSFVVRKKMRGNFSFQDLIKIGTLDERLFAFLKYCIIARMNILITGTTGTGKTTLLTLLIRELVPSYARIVVMEDTEEIVLSPDRHALKLLTRPSTTEGKYEVTLHDLVKLSLHMRPDRLVIGEIRGEEVFSLLQAVNTGHDGSMCTIHANNSQDAIARLEMLSLMARSNINIEVVRRFIKSGIDIIIHMNRYPGGRRLISQVSELSLDDNELVANDIFNLQRKIKDGKDDLHIQATGRVPFFMDRLKARTDIKDDFFKSN